MLEISASQNSGKKACRIFQDLPTLLGQNRLVEKANIPEPHPSRGFTFTETMSVHPMDLSISLRGTPPEMSTCPVYIITKIFRKFKTRHSISRDRLNDGLDQGLFASLRKKSLLPSLERFPHFLLELSEQGALAFSVLGRHTKVGPIDLVCLIPKSSDSPLSFSLPIFLLDMKIDFSRLIVCPEAASYTLRISLMHLQSFSEALQKIKLSSTENK